MTRLNKFLCVHVLAVAATGTALLLGIPYVPWSFERWYSAEAVLLLGMICLGYATITIVFNRRKLLTGLRPGRIDPERLDRLVRSVATSRKTQKLLLQLDGLINVRRGKSEKSFDANLLRYQTLIDEIVVQRSRCVMAAVFYDGTGSNLTMHVPASLSIIRHECLHVYQEAVYHVLRIEKQGRLSIWAVIQAELEVNYVNSRAYYIFWMAIVSFLCSALALALLGTSLLSVLLLMGI